MTGAAVPVCQRCGHRHPTGCANHVWDDTCHYTAGIDCTGHGLRELPPAVDQIIEAVLRYEKAQYNLMASTDVTQSQAMTASHFGGIVTGLRLALCALHGWPLSDADVEGPADQLVRQHDEGDT